MTRDDLDVIVANVGGQLQITKKAATSLYERLLRSGISSQEEQALARCVLAGIESSIGRLPPLSAKWRK